MTGKTKVIDPFQQELYQDTPWITRNRELNTQTYDLYNRAIEDLGRQNQDYYEAQASKAMQSAWGDYNRNYQKAVNQNLARNYGRTGSTASTSGGYVTDSLQRQYNDAAARLATQQAQYQDQFINSALNRDLAKLGTYGDIFNTSGVIPEEVDRMNYQIDQQNKQRQWQADATRQMNKKGIMGTIGQIGGTAIGAYFGGPVGAQIGNALGGAIGGSFDNQYVMPGQQASQPSFDISGIDLGDLKSTGNWDKLTNKVKNSKIISNLFGNTANASGGFKPTFSGYTKLFGN